MYVYLCVHICVPIVLFVVLCNECVYPASVRILIVDIMDLFASCICDAVCLYLYICMLNIVKPPFGVQRATALD